MKRPLLLTMLLLMAVVLFIPNIYATTTSQQHTEIIANNTTNEYNNTVNNQETTETQKTTASSGAVSETLNNQGLNHYTFNSLSTKTSNESQQTANIQYAIAAAGDETSSNVQNNWFTTKNITEAAGRVKNYIETNHKLPSYVKIGTTQVTMPQFLKLLTTGLIQINKGNSKSITVKNIDSPTNSIETLKSGTLTKTEYLNIATRIENFLNNYGRAPGYTSTSLGKIQYQNILYTYSKIMAFYSTNSRLPNTVSVKPWTGVNNQTAGNTSQNTGNTSVNSFSIAQISSAAGVVKTFIEKNQRLPNYVEISGKQITLPEFLRLLNTGLLQVYGNNKSNISLKTTATPTSPSEDLKSGNIYKSEYINLANRIQSYLNSMGRAPNYASSTLGKIRYENLIYLESRILNFYAQNNVLPNYAALNPWTKTSNPSIPSSYSTYLKSTDDCQSANQSIINLSNSITSGKKSVYDKATAIFNWVNNNTTYAFYYNTVKGALGTLSSGSANCCDTTHLLIGLTRAAGIPARYVHGVCTFSDGDFGHVWAQVYVDGKWYYADAVSSRNTFGVINNWNTSNWTLVGIYAELPF